jgi:hypothetical protein
MKDPEGPGEKIAIVQILETLAFFELLGGVILLFTVKTTEIGLDPTTFTPLTSEAHDWVAGITFLAAAIFFAALLFGFAHLIQDLHDVKRRLDLPTPQTPNLSDPPSAPA